MNISLNSSKYIWCCSHIKTPLFASADIWLSFIPIVGILLAIISSAVPLGVVIGAFVLIDSFANVKVNTYDKKCKHITKCLDRLYLVKQNTLRDGNIDAKDIDTWKQILNEYNESLKEITTLNNEEKLNL